MDSTVVGISGSFDMNGAVSSPRALLAPALALAGLAVAPAGGGAQPPPVLDPNPCIAPPPELLCPDLVMQPPFGIKIDRTERRGRVLLRAGNSIDSMGAGPVELHGRRDGLKTMNVRQRIYRADGSRVSVVTGGRLFFKAIPGQDRYWKFNDAARFELWRIDGAGRRIRLERVGPKVAYCFRDLRRTYPRMRGAPRRFVYPACNQSRRRRSVTLGTSVGWSDVYPPGYHEQWIDVTGLRGTFAYVHIADPKNGIYESNEDNNESETIVRLPTGRVMRTRRGLDDYPDPQPGY
jgi:hypothetical protein